MRTPPRPTPPEKAGTRSLRLTLAAALQTLEMRSTLNSAHNGAGKALKKLRETYGSSAQGSEADDSEASLLFG